MSATINRRAVLASAPAVLASAAIAVPGPANAVAAPAGVSPKLRELINAHKAASENEDAAVNAQDEVWCSENGVPFTDDAVNHYLDAMHAADRALMAVVHYRCRSGADRYMKGEYLLQRVGRYGSGTLGLDEDFGLTALLRSMREEGRASN
ncbi:hypothetical protein [Aquibium microcysteis]|uniref:hypothetical protein n=1 Tax=Aquibium microcysteis TaxID=675281 RepID=UPI00165D240B|nr:hypothetical protein [Aquibium microcysteis]